MISKISKVLLLPVAGRGTPDSPAGEEREVSPRPQAVVYITSYSCYKDVSKQNKEGKQYVNHS